jgi:nitroreductase
MNHIIPESQLIDALHWRYATKAFDPSQKVPAETWAALEESVVLTASSFGLQPYRLVNVVNPQTRAALMPHAWGQRQVVDASHFVVFAARTAITEAEIDKFLDRIVAVRGGDRVALGGYRQMMTGMLLADSFAPVAPHWATRQAYIALGNLLTSAALLGVDACPMEGFVPAEFDKILGLQEQGYAAVVACALGYRNPDDKYAYAAKVRFPVSDVVCAV